MLVHILGKVDSPCYVNWILRKVPEMVDKSLKRVVASNEESLIRLSLPLILCLKTCGFRLIKWVSNSN